MLQFASASGGAYSCSRLQLAIHHGGAGTVAYALRAGIPSIIMPFFGDHHLWACRLHEMGCGPPAMSPGTTTAKSLSEVITSTLSDTACLNKLADVAKFMETEDGLGEAVRLLEHLYNEQEFPRSKPSLV